jgi:hypothetical protein
MKLTKEYALEILKTTKSALVVATPKKGGSISFGKSLTELGPVLLEAMEQNAEIAAMVLSVSEIYADEHPDTMKVLRNAKKYLIDNLIDKTDENNS